MRRDRWTSSDLSMLKESVPVQQTAYRRHKLLLQAILLGAVYSMLSWTVMAQEPVGEVGEPQKLTAAAKEELSSAPAKVDVTPVARDEEILRRLQARQAQPLKNGENLLPIVSGTSASEKQTKEPKP
jgi:hypothetical protein